MVTIQVGISENQKTKAAEIIYEAIGDKLRHIFGPKEKGIPFLSEYLCDERLVVALDNGTLAGVSGLQYKGKTFIDISFWQMLRELKWGIFKFLFVELAYFSGVKPDEIVVEALAVDSTMRGKGIGDALLTSIIDFARSNQYKTISLFVVDTNKRAKAFYEKTGFTEKKMRKMAFPWNKFLDINAVFEMVYTL
jgi:ribosomal protein S18 acetylase RimI-like enzyme